MIVKKKKRVLSGIQPSGDLHLGNYFGMMSKMIEYQTKNELFCFIADLHALTVLPSPKTLSSNTFNAVCDFLALGLEPDKTTFWVQSDVPEVTELAWILSSHAGVGLMDRSTTYKDKIAKGIKPNMGLYSYPLLMAADILLFDSNIVPVGKDQKQHIELARDIASSFNNMFSRDDQKDFFSLPEPQILGQATRVMSLRDGTKKMSKSDPSDASRINLTDSKEEISNKFKKAKTDPHPLPETLKELSKRPEALNLINIYSSLSNQSIDQTLSQFCGQGFSSFKPKLIDLAIETLNPISYEMRKLLNDRKEIDKILRNGADNARKIAEPVLKQVKELVDFSSYFNISPSKLFKK